MPKNKAGGKRTTLTTWLARVVGSSALAGAVAFGANKAWDRFEARHVEEISLRDDEMREIRAAWAELSKTNATTSAEVEVQLRALTRLRPAYQTEDALQLIDALTRELQTIERSRRAIEIAAVERQEQIALEIEAKAQRDAVAAKSAQEAQAKAQENARRAAENVERATRHVTRMFGF